ncbi:unnamed protein product [Amoebophrya sp. A120]|nr:unnamed protein product [Amoebophrya sp. A120]|eukprot:GSA120T00014327001.1
MKQYLLRTALALRSWIFLLGSCSRFWFQNDGPNEQPQVNVHMVNAVTLISSRSTGAAANYANFLERPQNDAAIQFPQPVRCSGLASPSSGVAGLAMPIPGPELQHPIFEEDPSVTRSTNVWNREIVPAVAHLRNHLHLPTTSSRSARREDDNDPALPRLLQLPSYTACPLAPHPRDVPFPEKLLSCYSYSQFDVPPRPHNCDFTERNSSQLHLSRLYQKFTDKYQPQDCRVLHAPGGLPLSILRPRTGSEDATEGGTTSTHEEHYDSGCYNLQQPEAEPLPSAVSWGGATESGSTTEGPGSKIPILTLVWVHFYSGYLKMLFRQMIHPRCVAAAWR